jgi:uroporphyrinogen decarboxylase
MAKKQDRMTSQERIAALYNREPVDRVPFVHRGYGFSAKNVGYPIADIYENPFKSFEAQTWTAEMYGSDATPWYTFVSYGAWEFGGEIKWPADRLESGPSVARRPVQTEEDLWNLELPDLQTAGAVPRMLEFAKLQEERGTQIAVICGSPFTHAANLCGTEQFMLWLAMSPETAHRALQLMTDHILQVVQYFVDIFGEGRVLARSAAPSESNYLISPKQFEEFALPYLTKLHTGALEMGAKTIYCHICGEQNKNLSLWAQVPMGDPGMLSFGHEVDIATAAEYFPQHIIAGNVNPQVIASGRPSEVYELCREAIEKGKKHCESGFVLMPGCEIPPTTPPYNMYTMRKAVEAFGWYD